MRTGYIKRQMTACFVVIFLISACGPRRNQETVAPLAEAKLVMMTVELGGAFGFAEKEMVEAFEELHPGVTFKRTSYSSFGPEEYAKRDDAPDIMTVWSGHELRNMMAQGLLIDQSDVWSRAAAEDAYPDSFRSVTDFEGSPYYLPLGYSWPAIYYNRAIFDQYGLQPPSTWNEFLLLCETLRDRGEIPLAVGGDGWWEGLLWFDYLNVRINGADFHRELMRGEANYDDPRLREVLNSWQSLIASRFFVESPEMMSNFDALVSTIRGDAADPITRQKAVMVFTNVFWVSDLPAVFQAELDFFPFPEIDPAVPRSEVYEAVGYVVPVKAANRTQALAYLEWMAAAENQTRMAQHLSTTPGFAPAHLGIPLDDLPPQFVRGIGLAREIEDVVPPFMSGVPGEMWGHTNTMRRALWRGDGEADIDEILFKWEEGRRKAWENGVFDE